MIVHHELKLVVGTPFGCAARLETAASQGSGLSIVEGRPRYSMDVPAAFDGYKRTLAVRNPYERAVLLWLWGLKLMSDAPESLHPLMEDMPFAKYINQAEREASSVRSYLRRSQSIQYTDLPINHSYWYTRTLRQCWLQLGLSTKPSVLYLDKALPAWAGVPYGEPVDWEQHFWRKKGGELRLNEGRVRVVNRLWASEDCCFLGGYDHLGEWETHYSSCNQKHKSGVK